MEPGSKPGVWNLKISVLCVSREGMNHWLVPEPVFWPLHQKLTPLAHISIWSQLAEWWLLPQTGLPSPAGPRSYLASLLTLTPARPHCWSSCPPKSMFHTEKISKNRDQIMASLCLGPPRLSLALRKPVLFLFILLLP